MVTRRNAMVIGMVLGMAAGWLAYVAWLAEPAATADADRTITVDTRFVGPGQPDGEGASCGYTKPVFDPDGWPLGKQVVIADADGAIVGTVDLLDVFDMQVSDAALPGTIDGDGMCRVEASVDVPDSAFYTFTVDGDYAWTISADDLAARDWVMDVLFVSD